jgi:hypothetical protein
MLLTKYKILKKIILIFYIAKEFSYIKFQNYNFHVFSLFQKLVKKNIF